LDRRVISERPTCIDVAGMSLMKLRGIGMGLIASAIGVSSCCRPTNRADVTRPLAGLEP
jgi:hypothetical protein